MGQEANGEQPGSSRAVRAEPSVPHGWKHEQPREQVCAQGENERRNRAPRTQPESRASK